VDTIEDIVVLGALLVLVGLDFHVASFGDFNCDGSTDMVLRNKNTGQFELYSINRRRVLGWCCPRLAKRNRDLNV
jgi:hypothetical protein